MKYFMGIDPGKSGALAVISEQRTIIKIRSFDRAAYLEVMREYSGQDIVCCLEHVGAMPGQGVTSMFSFGENFGWLQGALEASGIAYQLARPRVWKKDYSLNDSKQSSVDMCRRIFPDAGNQLRRTEKCRKDDDGIAEALLMAEYARRHF